MKWLSAVALTPLLLGGCSDDLPEGGSMSDRQIRFSVAANAIPSATRSGTEPSQTSQENVPVRGGETELWLVPRYEEMTEILPAAMTTRATEADTETMESFGVYASRADAPSDRLPEYMRNVEVTRESSWTPREEYLWPGDGALRFFAYSPYVSEGAANGITALPSEGNPTTISYMSATTAAEQQDLLYCPGVEASASPCQLQFSHALAEICFETASGLEDATISSVELSGVSSEGRLDLLTGSWSGLEGSSTFKGKGESFMLLPQTLGDDAEVTVVVATEGGERTLTASLAGQVWKQSVRTVYRISADPEKDSLILNVSGNLMAPYTGSTMSFNVRSYRGSDEGNIPVDWIAEFVDAEGNVIDRPVWISSMTLDGTDATKGSVVTELNDVVFLSQSEGTVRLRQAADINDVSGHSPYNLSSSTGATAVENSANTYLIHAPGKYSLPLVYGNAVKNGADNSAAYKTTSHNRYALKTFLNHLGNGITDPYIYNNAGCTPAAAKLLWEDQLNLVRNVSLSEDGHSLTFEIPQSAIRQGNALVSVMDAEGHVMWSWQLWVTDYDPSADLYSLTSGAHAEPVTRRNIGHVLGGDVVEFPEAEVLVRFRQVNLPEGIEPLTRTVRISQSGATMTTPEYNTFYQWGRKDPVMSSVEKWYDANHDEITVLPSVSITSVLSDLSQLPTWWTLNPTVMALSAHDQQFSYGNLWNVSLSTTANVKSVYDPSPAGFKVALGTEFRDLTPSWTVNDFTIYPSGRSDGLSFTDMGYRSGESGELSPGHEADIWLGSTGDRIEARCLVVQKAEAETNTNSLSMGFSVRSVKE